MVTESRANTNQTFIVFMLKVASWQLFQICIVSNSAVSMMINRQIGQMMMMLDM
jgi:hypothetical protein